MISTSSCSLQIAQVHEPLPCLENSLFLVVALVVANATASYFLILSLPLKGLAIIGVVCGTFPMKETVEILFSVCFVDGFETTFLVPVGFVFVKQSLIGQFV